MSTSISAASFIDEELKLYSAHSNIRGIPFLGDGMKQAQRKALWGFIARGENADKDTVERISSRCASETDYHHGVGSLESTIVSMAQSFAGSNNLPLIEGFGQFGNRLNRKPASSRYIKAKLAKEFRILFRKEDDIILNHHYSNGDKIEPIFFIPVLPMNLINGAEGLGTGHATYIMPYNPEDIKDTIATILKGNRVHPGSLVPWFRGYTGTVEKDLVSSQITIRGKYVQEGNLMLRVIELPVGMQSDQYETYLYKLIDRGVIKNFVNQSDEDGFDFEISVPKSFFEMSEEEIMVKLKLISKETENLTLWDTSGVLRKYGSVEEIIEEFVVWRLDRYEDRRLALISKTEEDILWLDERIRFINFYLANSELFRNTGKKDLLLLLEKEEFSNPEKFLSMQLWVLTKDKIEELQKELTDKLAYLEKLQADTNNKMFIGELKELEL
jgi:DNA topoisomerase-2